MNKQFLTARSARGILVTLIAIFCFACTERSTEKEEVVKRSLSSGLGAVFAPDDSKMAFYSYEGMDPGSARIFTSNLDGSELKELTVNDTTGMHTEPTWSPNGKYIGYTNFLNDRAELRQVNVETGEVKALPMISTSGFHMFSSWGREEGQYYFFHWPNGGFEPDCYFYDGEKIHALTNDGISIRPQMSTSGDLYISKIVNEEKRDYELHLYNQEAGTSKWVSDMDAFFIWKDHYYTRAEVKEDSTTVLYQSNLENQEEIELGVVPVKEVMFQYRNNDGSMVLLNSGFSEGSEIFLLNTQTKAVNKLSFSN